MAWRFFPVGSTFPKQGGHPLKQGQATQPGGPGAVAVLQHAFDKTGQRPDRRGKAPEEAGIGDLAVPNAPGQGGPEGSQSAPENGGKSRMVSGQTQIGRAHV